jgi:flagellar protein FlbD
MITLTRLNGSAFALNCDLIERVDATPDTVLVMLDGSRYVVSEPLTEVIARVRRHRAEVVALCHQLETGDVAADDDEPLAQLRLLHTEEG